MSYYHGQKLGKALMAEGLCPPHATRVALRIPVDGAVYIRYDVLLDTDDIPKLQRALGSLMEKKEDV